MDVQTTQKNWWTCEHVPCGYSMSIIWAFDHIENKHSLYHWENCMKNLCFRKKEDVTVDKKRAKIPWRCNGMLHLWKKIYTKVCYIEKPL